MATALLRRDRARELAALTDERFDLIIVGGGITGAALACLATSGPQPMRVALLEAAALASGTSSRSSRLLHGGLRYLAHGRFGLVRRLLAGRAELAAFAPELVSPAPFLLPLGPRTPHAVWLLRAALALYGRLERRGPRAPCLTRARRLDRREAAAAEPLAAALAAEGALTYDGRALFASPRGAQVLIGTTEVEHRGAPEDVAPTRPEVAYLLRALASAVPGAALDESDVLAAFAGVRPLPRVGGDAGALDRGYVVAWDEPGFLALRGGKLTLALDGARQALRALQAEARVLGLPERAVPPFGALTAPVSAPSVTPRRARARVAEPVTWRVA